MIISIIICITDGVGSTPPHPPIFTGLCLAVDTMHFSRFLYMKVNCLIFIKHFFGYSVAMTCNNSLCKPQFNSYLLSFHLCWLQAEVIINYHIGETILSLQKTTLIPGGSESLVYTTLSGGIGILVPFTSHEVQFLKFWINSSYARGVLTCNDLS